MKNIPPRKMTLGSAGRGMASSSSSPRCARSGLFDDDTGSASAGLISQFQTRQPQDACQQGTVDQRAQGWNLVHEGKFQKSRVTHAYRTGAGSLEGLGSARHFLSLTDVETAEHIDGPLARIAVTDDFATIVGAQER